MIFAPSSPLWGISCLGRVQEHEFLAVGGSFEGTGVAYPGKEKTVGKDESHGVHFKKSEELPCVRKFTENL